MKITDETSSGADPGVPYIWIRRKYFQTSAHKSRMFEKLQSLST